MNWLCSRCSVFLLLLACAALNTNAQMNVYGGKENDNNCKTFYLVNSTDSIFYVAGLKQDQLKDCQTFSNNARSQNSKFTIDVSTNEDHYLLLLPKDTIVYNILIGADNFAKEKELSLLFRNSPCVIATNKDKKRNRQIKRLPRNRIVLPVIEK
jgi:hypothetical protein